MDYYKMMKKINRIIFPKHVDSYSAFYYTFNKSIPEKKLNKIVGLITAEGFRVYDKNLMQVCFNT